jgi:hypothetical protein
VILISKVATKGLALIGFGLLLLVSCRSSVEFHIAVDGKDTSPGTQTKPFATLERARDAIRQLKETAEYPSDGLTVWLHEGEYRIEQTFELSEQDSGSPEAPVVYRGCPGAAVSLTGGVHLDSAAFTGVKDAAVLQRFISAEARQHVLQVDLKDLGISNYGEMCERGFRRPYINPPMELFFNGEAMQLARWPNDSVHPVGEVIDPGSVPRFGDFTNRGGTFTYDFARPEKWGRLDNIWIGGILNKPWADIVMEAASIDVAKKEITLVNTTMYGIESSAVKDWGHESRGFYFLNVLDELDRPGEWFLDRADGLLYFWPPSPINESRISITQLDDPMVVMENTSHVTFRDLTFELTRGIGIYMEGGEGNLVAGCTLRNIGVVAVCIGRGIAPVKELRHNFTGVPISRELGSWHEHIYDNTAYDRKAGRNHGIVGCDIYNIGAGAISLGGGDRKTLTPAGNFVVNCDIHHYNRLDRSYRSGINVEGVGNRIAHNWIHHSPAMGIYLHGNDHVIEYNEICHVVEGKIDDMGGIYMGRDPSERGNIIRFNYWHDIGPSHKMVNAVYLDDGASGTVVFGNVFHKAGSSVMGSVMINGGWDNIVENNVFVDCPTALNATARWQGGNKPRLMDYIRLGGLWRVRLEESVRYDAPPYSTRYPALAGFFDKDLTQPAGNRFAHNILCNVKTVMRERGSPKVIQENNREIDPAAAAIDAAGEDLSLKTISTIYRQAPGFKPIPIERMGLVKDDYRK